MHGTVLDENGLPTEPMWFVFKDGKQVGNATTNETEAKSIFNEAADLANPEEDNPLRYWRLQILTDLIETMMTFQQTYTVQMLSWVCRAF